MISNVIPNILTNVSNNLIGTAEEEPSAVFWTTKTTTVTFTLRGTAGKVISISWGDGNSTELPLQGLSTSVNFVHDYLGLAGTKKITMTGDLLNVTYLSAPYNNLTRNLSSVAVLTSLTYLSLFSNNLTGDLSPVAALTNLVNLYLYTNQLTFTYTIFPAWSGTNYYFDSTVSTSTEVDNLLIAAANGGVNNCIFKVGGTNPARTSASDAAIATLLAAGVTVYVNE